MSSLPVLSNVSEGNEMQTFRDFHIWYNNVDVQPFCDTLEKMCGFGKIRTLTCWGKEFPCWVWPISLLPWNLVSSSPCLMRRTKMCTISLRKTWWMDHASFSIAITKRKRQRSEKKRWNFKEKNQKYAKRSWAMMPIYCISGLSCKRCLLDHLRDKEKKQGLKKRTPPRCNGVAGMEGCRRVIHIRHQMNDTEKRIGERRMPVEGFRGPSQTVFQFHGCWCMIIIAILLKERKWMKSGKKMSELRNATKAISKYIKDQGYYLVKIWECQRHRLKRSNPRVQHFLRNNFQCTLDNHRTLTKDQILTAIKNECLFGVWHLRSWPSKIRNGPIFKNTEISRDDIEPYMQTLCGEGKHVSTPEKFNREHLWRKDPVGHSTHQIIFWAWIRSDSHLSSGGVHIRVSPCFQPFGEAVCDTRRAEDVDPNKAIIADTMKLVSNITSSVLVIHIFHLLLNRNMFIHCFEGGEFRLWQDDHRSRTSSWSQVLCRNQSIPSHAPSNRSSVRLIRSMRIPMKHNLIRKQLS